MTITIDKAIELLDGFLSGPGAFKVRANRDAVKLGIEALQRVKQERTGYESYAPDLLPGETT